MIFSPATAILLALGLFGVAQAQSCDGSAERCGSGYIEVPFIILLEGGWEATPVIASDGSDTLFEPAQRVLDLFPSPEAAIPVTGLVCETDAGRTYLYCGSDFQADDDEVPYGGVAYTLGRLKCYPASTEGKLSCSDWS